MPGSCANFTEDLFVDAAGLEGLAGKAIQDQARAYAAAVIAEWQDIKDQADSDLPSHAAVEELTLLILDYEPESDKDTVIYSEIFGGLNELLDLRRERLHLGREGVGPVTWLVVAMGAFITIGMTWFYHTDSARTHYGLVGMKSVMFSLMIFLIVAMDHPLLGRYSVDSSPFQEAHADMAVWQRHLNARSSGA